VALVQLGLGLRPLVAAARSQMATSCGVHGNPAVCHLPKHSAAGDERRLTSSCQTCLSAHILLTDERPCHHHWLVVGGTNCFFNACDSHYSGQQQFSHTMLSQTTPRN